MLESSLAVCSSASSAWPGTSAQRSAAANDSSTVASPVFASERMTRATASAICVPTRTDGSGRASRDVRASRRTVRSPSRAAPRRQCRTATFFSCVAASSRVASGRPPVGSVAARRWAQKCSDSEAMRSTSSARWRVAKSGESAAARASASEDG